MSDNIKSMHPVIADFCGLLESKNVPYQLNDNDENMIRFRTRLPHHEATPYVIIHMNPANQALTLSLSNVFRFTSLGPKIFQLMNVFNGDAGNFACKMFVDQQGELVVLVSAIVAGEDPRDQVEDYLNVSILALDNYYAQIKEIIDESQKD
ncbi:YbjN domain-containing protein [Ruminococcus flavefaciens]|uniref:Sensory transduction regulator n=1 Tax=Ruminococcus flavefaciens 007c TaxID=1341157 RepID=W7UWQ7_RUMFL|nr:YbjN domain-containing protein [Ruminococcus flavefaciens]EWM52817.1 hypothetical protein RF007C_14480 [Ruminococcus flavefaciens 007c]